MCKENKMKLGKEYRIATFSLLIVAIISVIILSPLSNSRGEVIAIYFGSIFFFIMGLFFNLLYFSPIKIIEIRLLLPGILTIITPILMRNNIAVGIPLFTILGIINFIVGFYFYINIRINKNKNASR